MSSLNLVIVLTMTVFLPGLGFQALLLPSGHRDWVERIALALILPLSVAGVAATLLGPLGIPPIYIVGGVSLVGLAFLPRARTGFGPLDRTSGAALAGAALLAVTILVTFPPAPLTSDLWAHSAAVRACLTENAVFPQHEFYPPGSGTGPDPRFGAGHAIFSVWCRLARIQPHLLWPWITALSLFTLVLVAFRLGLATTRHKAAAALAALAFVVTLGGDVYNVLRVAGFPLWLALAHVSLPIAMALDRDRPTWRLGLLAGLILAGAGALHAFAFIVGGMLLAIAAAVAPAPDRGRWVRFAVAALILSIPVVVVRFLVSYGNANPIHQWPWRVVKVGADAYMADPLFLARWWLPWGLIGAIVGVCYLRRFHELHVYRWSLALWVLVLLWLLLPPVLTPSIHLLGFLPIRLPVAVVFAPFFGLAAEAWLTSSRRGWGRGVFALVAVSMLWTLGGKASRSRASSDEGAYVSTRVLEDLTAHGPDTVVLSDPFTMMMLKAQSDVSIVAVPDGRSSPRDAEAIVRLRDSWRALSPATSLEDATDVLAKYDVDFVLLNHRFETDRTSYEYPVDTESFGPQLAKFDERGLGLELVRQTGREWLFRVGAASRGSGYTPMTIAPEAAAPDASPQRLHEHFFLVGARAERHPADRKLMVRGWLGWDGIDAAPDRRLVVRMDHEVPPVPAALEGIGKPVRKIRERLEKRRYRTRWTILPAGGAIPTYRAAPGRPLPIEADLPIPANLAPGRYRVTLQAVPLAEFEPLTLRDFVRDDDFYRGPTIGAVEIE